MIFLISCVDRFVIPSDINTGGTGQFGAGDTIFLQGNPLWDNDFGLDQPEEISISQDGRIFVADKGNNSILVFDQNGSIPESFEKLKNLNRSDLVALIPAGFESYCWKSIKNISDRNVDGLFVSKDFKNIFKKGTFFGENTNKLAEMNSDYNFFPDSIREPKLMVGLSNKLINEKKQEEYYD